MSESAEPEKKTFWEEWRGFIIFIVIMFAFRIGVAAVQRIMNPKPLEQVGVGLGVSVGVTVGVLVGVK